MPLMNLFEPIFVLLVLVTVAALVSAGILALRGKSARAGRILRRLAIGAGAYFAIVVAVSIFKPALTYHLGDTQCFEDWCIAVVSAQWTGNPTADRYEVALRLSNRAKRVPMGEKGTVVYLTDGQGRRYDPLPDRQEGAFDTRLRPGESISAWRSFDVPRDTPDLALVYTHHGGFPIGWLIIAEGGWFQKPNVVQLNEGGARGAFNAPLPSGSR